MVEIRYAYTPYFTPTRRVVRDVRGVVLHSTQTDGHVSPHRQGSWHYSIDRDGTIYQFVDEADVAWHVRAADRIVPIWLPNFAPYAASIPNCWTIGIELVSGPAHQKPGDDIPSYTQAQYAALAALVRVILDRYELDYSRVVTHGELQRDRSDPVDFDFSVFYDLLNTPQEDPAVIAELEAKLAAANGLLTEYEQQNESLKWLLGVAQSERDAFIAEVDRLRAGADGKAVREVVVRFSDGDEATLVLPSQE